MNSSLSPSSDQLFRDLLRRARRGDPDALGKIIEACRPYLLKIANDEGDDDVRAKYGASDIVQTACLDAVKQFRTFRGRSSKEMFVWLKTILRHRLHGARDEFETDKRHIGNESAFPVDANDGPHALLEAPPTPPEAQLIRNEESDKLERALADLSFQDRMIIELRHKEGQAFAEIARQLSLTEEATRKRWARALENLQKKVQ